MKKYDFSKKGEPTLEWFHNLRNCIMVLSQEQVKFINQDKWLKIGFHSFCVDYKIVVKVIQ